jgi:WD40 repeat protein
MSRSPLRCLVSLLSGWFVYLSIACSQAEPTRTTDLHGDELPADALVRLGTTRWRHGGASAVLAYSPDGRLLASGGHYGILRLWDAVTGKEVRRLNIREQQVNALAFSPDGTKLAAVGAEGRLALFEVGDGREVNTWGVSAKTLLAVAFSPDGKHLAVAGTDGVILLVDWQSGKRAGQLEGHSLRVSALAFTPDGKALASASDDRTVRFWERTTGQEICRIRDALIEYHGLAFSRDGKQLATVGAAFDKDGRGPAEERLQIWETAALTQWFQQRPDAKQIKQLVANLDDKSFTVRQKASQDLTNLGPLVEPALKDALAGKPSLEMTRRIEELLDRLKQGPPPPGEQLHTLTAGELVRGISLTPDGKTLAAAERDGIRFWDARSGKELHKLISNNGPIGAVAFAPDGRTLAYSDQLGLIGLAVPVEQRWASTTHASSVQQGHIGTVESVSFSPDGKTVAGCSAAETIVRIWDAQSGKELRRLNGPERACHAAAFTSDGKTLAAGGEIDGGIGIRVWDAATWQEIRTIRAPGRWWAFRVGFSPDGKLAGAAHWSDAGTDGGICRWNVRSGEQLGPTTYCRQIRSAPAVFSDGKTFALGDYDKKIQIQDAAAKQELHRLTGHEHEVWRVAVSPGGKYLAAVGDNGAAGTGDCRLWETATGKEMHRLEIRSSQAVALAFSSDSRQLATGGDDGVVRLWDVATGKLERSLKGPTAIHSVAFSPDGKRLASGGADTAVLIWDLRGKSE